jgi:hypothetical protein
MQMAAPRAIAMLLCAAGQIVMALFAHSTTPDAAPSVSSSSGDHLPIHPPAESESTFPSSRFMESLRRTAPDSPTLSAVQGVETQLQSSSFTVGMRMLVPLVGHSLLTSTLRRASILAMIDQTPGLRSDHLINAVQHQRGLDTANKSRIVHYIRASPMLGIERYVDKLLELFDAAVVTAIADNAVRMTVLELQQAMARIESKRARIETAMASEVEHSKQAAHAAEAAAGLQVRGPTGGASQWPMGGALASLAANQQLDSVTSRGGEEPACMDASVAADRCEKHLFLLASCRHGVHWYPKNHAQSQAIPLKQVPYLSDKSRALIIMLLTCTRR